VRRWNLHRAPQTPSWLASLLRSAYEFLEAGRQLLQPCTLLLLISTALYMLVYVIYLDAMVPLTWQWTDATA
jgi:hypothetical protein